MNDEYKKATPAATYAWLLPQIKETGKTQHNYD